MIIESIITSSDKAGCVNVAPFGIKLNEDIITISPYIPSKTLENILYNNSLVINYVDDANIYVDCIVGEKKFKLNKCKKLNCYYLKNSIIHHEAKVIDYKPDPVRPIFECKIIYSENHNDFMGINRARSALIEACILATRTSYLGKSKILSDLEYLSNAINKTSGKIEKKSWTKIKNFINKKLSKNG